MHRELRKLLHTATGESHFVVVVFLDVRGFSSFARMAESSESAVFLKSAYTRILDEYFDDASFFKPTGDGLLIVLDYDEESLRTVVQKAVSTSVRLVEAFPTICAGDPMVNFEVPGDLGIGVARGAATRMNSGDYTLDYSGRPLNLAARLMDIARPAGVVFSDALGVDLLDPDLVKRFAAEDVYVKGLAEDLPMRVHYLAGTTIVADAYKRPLRKTRIHAEPKQKQTVAAMEGMGNYRLDISKEPYDRSQIRFVLNHPFVTPSGAKRKGLVGVKELFPRYEEDAQGAYVRVDFSSLATELKSTQRLKRTWEIAFWLEYAVADED